MEAAGAAGNRHAHCYINHTIEALGDKIQGAEVPRQLLYTFATNFT
jgi:hypothetical protein